MVQACFMFTKEEVYQIVLLISVDSSSGERLPKCKSKLKAKPKAILMHYN